MRIWLNSTFWAISIGFLLASYSYGLASASLLWIPQHTPDDTVLYLAWPLIWYSVGIALGAVFADFLGRKTLLMYSPWLYFIGTLLFFHPERKWGALLGSVVLLIASGIESNTLLVLAQELSSKKMRAVIMYTELNFVNLGAVVLATLAYASNQLSPLSIRDGNIIWPTAIWIVALILRLPLHESRAWQSGRKPKPPYRVSIPHYFIRFVVASAFSLSSTTGYSLLGFAYGRAILPHFFRHFLILSTISSFATGLTAHYLAKISPKWLLIWSYALATAITIVLGFLRTPDSSPVLFWACIFGLSAATSVSYLTEDTFKTEKWPPRLRSRLVGTIRITGMGGFLIVLLLTRQLHFSHLYFIVAMCWSVGLIAAIIWWKMNELWRHHAASTE